MNIDEGIIMKYRKKEPTIEAMQFTDENKDMVYHWAQNLRNNVYPSFRDNKPVLIVPVRDGETECLFGDYLIKGSLRRGEEPLLFCKQDDFEKMYVKAE